MQDRTDITVPMPELWRERIDEQLEYGDTRSAWIREAIRQKLVEEGVDPEELDAVLEDDAGNLRAAAEHAD